MCVHCTYCLENNNTYSMQITCRPKDLQSSISYEIELVEITHTHTQQQQNNVLYMYEY